MGSGDSLPANNHFFSPVPVFEYATRSELVVWGGCMALAAILAGWFVVSLLRSSVTRRGGWLLACSAILFCGGWITAMRVNGRLANERVERFSQQQREESDQKGPERLHRAPDKPDPREP